MSVDKQLSDQIILQYTR